MEGHDMSFSKRIVSALLVSTLLVTLGACANNNNSPTGTTTPVNNSVATDDSKDTTTATSTSTEKVSEDIHINQLGYKPNDKKVAIINGIYDKFTVIEKDSGKEVLSKKLEGKVKDMSSGDTVCYADFTELTIDGTYYIAVENVGKSYDFDIGNNVYRNISDALVKGLYYQRCGMELESKYAGDYAHANCHKYLAKMYGNEEKEVDTLGGWHDAGDYGKYSVAAAITAADLLLAYEFYPENFTSSINIPESSNNIPDILDEAKYGIQWLLKMQDPATGGVYHKVTSRGFPDIIVTPEIDVDDPVLTPVSSTATGDFAAVTAMAARTFMSIDKVFADKCLEASQKAWEWLEKNNKLIAYKNPSDIATGEYGDDNDSDERLWAAGELFRTTGDKKYEDYFIKNYSSHGLALGWQNTSGFAAISYLYADNTDEHTYNKVKKDWLDKAKVLAGTAKADGYMLAMVNMEYSWGSNMNVMNHAIHLLIADNLESNPEYVQYAKQCGNYLVGANCLNQSYVTGFGSKQVMQPHHRPSTGDSVKAPVPGLVAGGPNASLDDEVSKSKLADLPPARCYIDDVTSYATNEIDTYWNSPAVFVFAAMNSK